MNQLMRIQRREPSSASIEAVHEDPLLSRVLINRGIEDAEELAFKLSGLPRPDGLLGLDKALDRIVLAIVQDQQILIVGDYDCDGATSTTLAVDALRSMGVTNVDFLVPNRLTFGYGLSVGVIDHIVGSNHAGPVPDLIITVDNGVASVEGVERAKVLGIDVVVTDHHLPPAKLPEAVAIINPNIPGATFPTPNLAGVGVIFFVMAALRTRLCEEDWFEAKALPVPSLADSLDLVAIGTVADVVELDRINRILVEQGLRRIRAARTRPGVKALCQVAGVRLDQVVSQNIGFAIGPRLNAAGRIADIDVGISCLLTTSDDEAMRLAKQLDQLNQQRRSIESEIRFEAEKLVTKIVENLSPGVPSTSESRLSESPEQKQETSTGPLILCLYEKHWHEGVIGIVAGRIKEKMNIPVFVFGGAKDGLIKGSGRSIPQLHLRDVLQEVSNRLPQGVLQKFGGHAMAAGLTLRENDFAQFVLTCEAVVAEVLGGKRPGRVLESDGALEVQDYDLQTAAGLRSAVPWGQGFPEPIFDGYFSVSNSRILKQKHLKLTLCPVVGDQITSMTVEAIAFDQAQEIESGTVIRLAFRLGVNEFRGESRLQLFVLHIEND